jgi:hypothetical protein
MSSYKHAIIKAPQARQRIWGRGWPWKLTLISFISAIVAAIAAAILARTKVM